jgi:hypothetical protein
MLGAIAGDVFGASYEFRSFKHEDFDLFSKPRFFTDDTVLTIATAEVLMGDGDYAAAYRRWHGCHMGATFRIVALSVSDGRRWHPENPPINGRRIRA